MLGRIDPVMAAGQHRDRAACDRIAMRGLVDAARQPGDNDKTASWLANFNPAPDALREPTIAIIGRAMTSGAQRTPSSGGASSSVASRGG